MLRATCVRAKEQSRLRTQGVREVSATSSRHLEWRRNSNRPAHPSNRLVAQLNGGLAMLVSPSVKRCGTTENLGAAARKRLSEPRKALAEVA